MSPWSTKLQDQLGIRAGSAQPFVMDGFWSISVYNAAGYFEPNDRGAYSVNNITAVPDDHGSGHRPLQRL